ncbi:hypothetical protein SK128_028174, partial [Halocaridina rubra]
CTGCNAELFSVVEVTPCCSYEVFYFCLKKNIAVLYSSEDTQYKFSIYTLD